MIVILRKKDLQRRDIFARDLHSRVHKMIIDTNRFYFTKSPLCCREMSELHQSILLLWIFNFANKASTNKIDYQIQSMWTKWHAGLPLALKDGLRDLVSQEAIRFNGLHFTRSSLHLLFDQPGSSSHLDSINIDVILQPHQKRGWGNTLELGSDRLTFIFFDTLCDPHPIRNQLLIMWFNSNLRKWY